MLVLLLVLAAGSAATPPPPLSSPAAARVAHVRDAMRPLGRETRLGPWRLFTDIASAELPALDAVATNVAEAFRTRTGLAAEPDPGQVVAIFTSDSRYRVFADRDAGSTAGVRGRAGGGLAAFAAGRDALETRAALVHGLARLLARGALGDAPPPWLDEGLAEDLAWCRVDPSGHLAPGTVDGGPGTGPRATVDDWIARAKAGRVFPLAALLSPASSLYADPGARRDAATESAFLVRWCLAEPARAARFRAFLGSVSRGGPADLRAIAAALGTDGVSLERDFLAWTRAL